MGLMAIQRLVEAMRSRDLTIAAASQALVALLPVPSFCSGVLTQ